MHARAIVSLIASIILPAAVMEMAAGGSLTSYVADKWQKAQAQGQIGRAHV